MAIQIPNIEKARIEQTAAVAASSPLCGLGETFPIRATDYSRPLCSLSEFPICLLGRDRTFPFGWPVKMHSRRRRRRRCNSWCFRCVCETICYFFSRSPVKTPRDSKLERAKAGKVSREIVTSARTCANFVDTNTSLFGEGK